MSTWVHDRTFKAGVGSLEFYQFKFPNTRRAIRQLGRSFRYKALNLKGYRRLVVRDESEGSYWFRLVPR